MRIHIHDPYREAVDVLRNQNGAFATASYSCAGGGGLTMYFNSPDDLRSEAAALKLLAEALEEEQAK